MPIPGGVADVIVSLADAKTALDDPNLSDDELQDYVDRATALLLNHPAYRVADAVSRATHTEWFDGGAEIVLAHYPVDPTTVTVTEFTGATSRLLTYEAADGGVFTGTGWAMKDGTGGNGILIRTSSGYPTVFCGQVKVAYTAGSSTVPADIRGAALDLILFWWRQAKAAGTQTYGDDAGALPAHYGIPNAVTEKLAAYLREPVSV